MAVPFDSPLGAGGYSVRSCVSERSGVMRRVFAVCAVALLACGATLAEEKKPAALPALPLYQLIANPAVQEELKLGDDQKKALEEASAEARQALRGIGKLEQAE